MTDDTIDMEKIKGFFRELLSDRQALGYLIIFIVFIILVIYFMKMHNGTIAACNDYYQDILKKCIMLS